VETPGAASHGLVVGEAERRLSSAERRCDELARQARAERGREAALEAEAGQVGGPQVLCCAVLCCAVPRRWMKACACAGPPFHTSPPTVDARACMHRRPRSG
jgi:hypothetical protein